MAASPGLLARRTCTGNYCYIETDAQELDLARRARNLGFSLELTLFFDGGGSQSTPGSYAGQTQAQVAASIYSYTKAEIEMYRKAGLMPDMVSIGNEVDNGFLGGPGFYPYNHFAAFAALEKAGLTAVSDAAADTTIGPAMLALKKLAIASGFDVPLYSVTGWDNGVLPPHEFLPGYPDAPWGSSLTELPPQEVYAFRFGSRVSGNMGVIGAAGGAQPI